VNIDFRKSGDVVVARLLERRFDAHGTADFKARVGEQLDRGERKLVLDLGEVEFVDSSGLGAILSVVRRMSGSGSLVLSDCRPGVLELMKLTRLDRVFHLVPTSEAAVKALAG
jgi:anti-sigma B factor antagonist